RFDFTRVAEVFHQERTHLPTVAHFFDHHPGDGTAVPVSGGGFEQMTLLLNAGKLGVTLINDHVEQGVAPLLGRNLAQVVPFPFAFEMAELNLVGLNGTEKRVELEAGDLVTIDANLFAPFVEEADPI